MYELGDVQVLHLQAIIGHPCEEPQPRIVISMSFKYIFYDWLGYNKLFLQAINNQFASDSILGFLKFLSSFFVVEAFALYYFLALFYYIYYFYKVDNGHHLFMRSINSFLVIGVAYSLVGFIFAFLKFNVNFERPLCVMDLYTNITIDSVRCLSSFPSGHSAVMTLILYALFPLVSWFARLVLVLIAMDVYIGRVILAVHFPADVLYSIVFTIMIILFSRIIVSSLKRALITPIAKKIFAKMRSV